MPKQLNFKIDVTDPAYMTGSAITREQAKIATYSSKICTLFIEAGRGHEKPSETWKKTDPLALLWRAVTDRADALRSEVQQRVGPGHYSLPHGVGRSPRKKG